VVALLVTPSATGFLLADRFLPMMLWGIAAAVLASALGLYASFYLNVASGAAIVVASTLLFFLVLAVRPARRAGLR